MGVMKPTLNGFNPFTVVSALQKHVRRNRRDEAYKCCLEMMCSKNYFSWLIRRLQIIAVEDIGPADWDALTT